MRLLCGVNLRVHVMGDRPGLVGQTWDKIVHCHLETQLRLMKVVEKGYMVVVVVMVPDWVLGMTGLLGPSRSWHAWRNKWLIIEEHRPKLASWWGIVCSWRQVDSCIKSCIESQRRWNRAPMVR